MRFVAVSSGEPFKDNNDHTQSQADAGNHIVRIDQQNTGSCTHEALDDIYPPLNEAFKRVAHEEHTDDSRNHIYGDIQRISLADKRRLMTKKYGTTKPGMASLKAVTPVVIGLEPAIPAAAKAASDTGGVRVPRIAKWKMKRCAAIGSAPSSISAGAHSTPSSVYVAGVTRPVPSSRAAS